MVIQSATYILDDIIPILVLETDFGKVIIDPTSIKMEQFEEELIYVGYPKELTQNQLKSNLCD
ncbi:MAG: hypothetical protein LCH54_13940 [Bacteroidetes bacterium]|nr:hypothetical protein [Bacteroidota bacterium]